jgi:hypothetical protein
MFEHLNDLVSTSKYVAILSNAANSLREFKILLLCGNYLWEKTSFGFSNFNMKG